MSPLVSLLVVLLPAYLLGAMPWGLWISRLKGIDIRTLGSGNLGATNVYRQIGPGFGLTVLLLDIGKGVAAVLWGKFGPGGPDFPGGLEVAAVAAGMVSIFGHVFTVFAGFRGGKGVATTIGVFLALTPLAMLAGLIAWLVVTVMTRRVSAGSLSLALVYPIVIYLTEQGPLRMTLLILGAIVSILIFVRHVENIQRLIKGTEPAFSLRKQPSQSEKNAQTQGRSPS